jgi:hypothetical protein
VQGEHVAVEQRLPQPRRRRHGRADRPLADDHEGIALKEVVGDRRQGVELRGRARDLGGRVLDPGHEGRGELFGRQVAQPIVHVRVPSERLAEVVEDRAPLLGDLKDFLEEVLDLEHLVGDVAEDLLEAAVLLPGAVPVEDVVEEELLHHRRHHSVDLRAGQVDENGLEFADFGIDS